MHPADELPEDAALQVEREMPRYNSHKQVWALEMESLNGPRLTFRDKGYAAILCESAMFSRYQPVAGDFYVTYDDGYKSFSPRKAFLEGYTWHDAPADSTGASDA